MHYSRLCGIFPCTFWAHRVCLVQAFVHPARRCIINIYHSGVIRRSQVLALRVDRKLVYLFLEHRVPQGSSCC